MIRSTKLKKTAVSAAMMNTMMVVITTSRRVGHTTFEISARVSLINLTGFVAIRWFLSQGASGTYALDGRFSSRSCTQERDIGHLTDLFQLIGVLHA